MAKRVCDYCGEKYDAAESRCPHCGGPNPKAARAAAASAAAQSAQTPAKKRGVQKPKTISELRDFAEAHNLPLNKMRVHIGEDYPNPKAFGIYQAEDGSFVVYKNKADGSRAIRYRGSDEAHAVSELYLKMKELVGSQKALQAEKARTRSGSVSRDRTKPQTWREVVKKNLWLYVVILIFCCGVWFVLRKRGPQRGYYRYNDDYYYYQNSNWYYYGDESWLPVYADDELQDNYDDYYQSSIYNYSYGVDNFYNSGYYDSGSNSNNDWNWDDDDDWDDDWDDDDWDWGGDDDWGWDDGGADWDSDW